MPHYVASNLGVHCLFAYDPFKGFQINGLNVCKLYWSCHVLLSIMPSDSFCHALADNGAIKCMVWMKKSCSGAKVIQFSCFQSIVCLINNCNKHAEHVFLHISPVNQVNGFV